VGATLLDNPEGLRRWWVLAQEAIDGALQIAQCHAQRGASDE